MPYNESYKGDNAEAGPYFDYARFVVEDGRLIIKLPASGWIFFTQQSWDIMVDEVWKQFNPPKSGCNEEEVEDGTQEERD